MIRILLVLFSALAAAGPVALRISSNTAPAGGFAQIQIYAVKPMAISSGHLVLSLDATAFGTGAVVGAFGANADAEGLVTTSGSKIDIQFSSATGGIGQLAGLPVLVVSVPVLASASGTVVVSATSPDSSVTVASGSVTISGALSVQKIYAGMGVVAAGTVVPVYGSGFTAATSVAMDGVEISSTKFVSAGEVDVTLGGATELVGKLARVTDGGVEFDYFCFQPSDPVNFPESTRFGEAVATVQPMFPLFAGTGLSGSISEIGGVVEVQNPNTTAAAVSYMSFGFGSVAGEDQKALSIPPGSWGIIDGLNDTAFVVTSNLPVRAVALYFCGEPAVALPVCLTPVSPYDWATKGAFCADANSGIACVYLADGILYPAGGKNGYGRLARGKPSRPGAHGNFGWLVALGVDPESALRCDFGQRESFSTYGWDFSGVDFGDQWELAPDHVAGDIDGYQYRDPDSFRYAGEHQLYGDDV